MNKGPSQIAAVLRQRYRPARRSVDAELVESTVPWTFNQILLPMILVLTAVVLTQILNYHEAFTKLLETEKDGPIKTRVLMINSQYWKLHCHLEQVKARTREAYLMPLFPEADRVRRNGTVPNDEDFKVYCDSIKHLESGYHDEAARIYDETLALAGVRDPEGTEFDRKDVVSLDDREVSPNDFRKDEELARKLAVEADSIDISYWNRNNIQRAILDFLDGTKQEATELQTQLITLIIGDRESMELSEDDRQMWQEIMAPNTSDQQGRRLGSDLLRKLIIQLEDRFENAGYDLIIWEQLKSK